MVFKMRNDKELLKKINISFEKATPDVLDSILIDCRSEKGRIITMEEKNSFSKFTKGIVVAACLALILVGIGGIHFYQENFTVATTVTIDVNPSLEIKVNEQEKVLEVIPLNEDAVDVIGEMNFNGSSIDITVNALVGSMFSKGYLDHLSNSILLSVEGDDDSSMLCEKLTQEINALINSGSFDGSVISQMITSSKELKALAEKYNISVGKAQLINTILGFYPEKSFEELAGLKLTELCLILCEDNFTGSGINVNGISNKNGYIGEEAALKKLTDHYGKRGVGADHMKNVSVKLAFYEGTVVYEIKHRFEYYNGNHSAISMPTTRINAITGEFVDIYDSGPVEDSLLVNWIDVPQGQYTVQEARQIIKEKYGFAENELPGNSVRFKRSYSTLKIDDTTDKDTPISELERILKYEFCVKKDGWCYYVMFSSDNGEVLETSRENFESIVK